MRRLILFRHAKAEPRAAGQDDFDRPLAPRGREDAAIVGRALADDGLVPDLALVSPARRTTETWISAREAFPPVRTELAPDLYDAAPETIRAAIDAVADRCDTLIVVGHNPGMHEVAVEVLIDASASAAEIERVDARFPTSTAAVYAIDAAGRASLEGVYLAKALGGEGEGVTKVYKIVDRDAWNAALAAGRFEGAAIDLRDGYIHLSTAAQAPQTARLHFAGQAGLVLLKLDAERLGAALKWEPSRGGDLFPHVYGPIDCALVEAVTDIALGPGGAPELGMLEA